MQCQKRPYLVLLASDGVHDTVHSWKSAADIHDFGANVIEDLALLAQVRGHCVRLSYHIVELHVASAHL